MSEHDETPHVFAQAGLASASGTVKPDEQEQQEQQDDEGGED